MCPSINDKLHPPLHCAHIQEHNTKCEAALFNLLSHHKPQTTFGGIKSMALHPVLFRFAQSLSVAQSVRPGISGKQESVMLKLRKSCFCPHSCKAGWPYLRGAVNSFWVFWCSNEKLSLCHTAKLWEGKGDGRIVQGEKNLLKKALVLLGPELHSTKVRSRCRDWRYLWACKLWRNSITQETLMIPNK